MEGLCTACLCQGRNVNILANTDYDPIYKQILNEISVYDTSHVEIKICWECCAIMKRFCNFRHKVKTSYVELMQLANTGSDIKQLEKQSNLKVTSVTIFTIPEIKIEYDLLDLENDRTNIDHDVILTDYIKSDEKINEEKVVSDDLVKNEELCEEHCEPETFVNDYGSNNEVVRMKKDVKGVKSKAAKEKKQKKIKIKKNGKKVRKKKQKSKDLGENNDSCHDYDDYLEPLVEMGVEEENRLKEIEMEKEDSNDCDIYQKSELVNDTVKIAKLNGIKPPRTPLKYSASGKPECAECGKVFSSKKTLRYHLNVLHKGNNRYPCPRCGKVYQWKSNLGRHMRSHKARDTGELYCETCDKRFASVATFRQHLSISKQHVSESEFSHICNECGKKFVSKTRLRDHIDWEHLQKIKFRCQLCNKPFKCHTSLYVHMKNVHRNKGLKDNLCHVCGKSYQNRAKLRYHIVAMHTTETPYQCDQCNAAFGWYSSLYRHIREVHYKMKIHPNKSKKNKKRLQEPLPPIMPTLPPLPPIPSQGPNLLANYLMGPPPLDSEMSQRHIIVNPNKTVAITK